MYYEIEEYEEPREILDRMSEPYAEMSTHDHGFLCGLLKKYQPNKVVEIGVCAGGTTGVIMNCLSKIGSNAQMFSIDLCEECYRRSGKKTGFLFDEVKTELSNYFNHQFILGEYYPAVADQVGDNIDFLILDTVHSLPGEFLDFIAILPYLKDGAIVVLHDVSLNLFDIRIGGSDCNRALLSCVSSEKKYYNFKELEDGCLPNIGAFVVDESTRNNIMNVIQTMTMSWNYMPNKEELCIYTEHYKKFYDVDCLDLWNRIVTMQKYKKYKVSFNGKDVLKDRKIFESELVKLCRKRRYVFLYGAGQFGRKLEKRLRDLGVIIDGFIVSDGEIIQNAVNTKVPIYHFSYICKEFDENDRTIIMATIHDSAAIPLVANDIEFVSIPEEYFNGL